MRYLAILILGLAGAYFVSEYQKKLTRAKLSYASVLSFLIYIRAETSRGPLPLSKIVKGYTGDDRSFVDALSESSLTKDERALAIESCDIGISVEDKASLSSYLSKFGSYSQTEEERRLSDEIALFTKREKEESERCERYKRAAGVLYATALSALAILLI